MKIHPGSLGCGCCEGISPITPESTENRPGLDALRYRVGTHSTFMETMLAAISDWPTLDQLTSRNTDDPSIGLLDAWATVLDVLTFYQERIVNEGYLPTAVESRSVRELAAALGYEPSPPVAAETRLAFEMEKAPGAPSELTIEAGAKVQSLPGPGEKPQLFETIGDLEARPEWNAMAVRQSLSQIPVKGDTEVYLDGVATGLSVGDGLLVVGKHREANPGSERWDFRRVTAVEPDADAGVTRVAWSGGLGKGGVGPATDDVKVYAFRDRVGIFGHNAPDVRLLPKKVKTSFGLNKNATKWSFDLTGGSGECDVDLDAVHEEVVSGSWVVLDRKGYTELYEVTAVVEASREDYTLVGKVSRLTLSGENLASKFDDNVRQAAVFVHSERLEMGAVPVTGPVSGKTVHLDEAVPELEDERIVMVQGRRAVLEVAEAVYTVSFVPGDGSASVMLAPGDRLVVQAAPTTKVGKTTWSVADPSGALGTVTVGDGELADAVADEEVETVAEQAELEGTTIVEEGVTKLTFDAALGYVYDRASCVVLANVAYATHGETKEETLGSGDAASGGQTFALSHKPLTYVPAQTASGSETTLTVRVNDRAWGEADTLYQAASRARVYLVTHVDDGTVTVRFGDGEEGVRLTTGMENVKAEYRVGGGREGMVDADQLSLLMSRPLGLKGVTNPVAAEGAADAESRDEARRNAPLTVLTFDRIVSVTDYEDFARNFPGVAKASGEAVWNGSERIVHVTIAGTDGEHVGEGTTVHNNLTAAILGAGASPQQFQVAGHDGILFDLAAGLFVDPAYDPDAVLEQASADVAAAYSFSERDLVQPVPLAEVAALLQSVPGVAGVDVDKLAPQGGSGAADVVALAARPEAGKIAPAQLLTINPAGISLVVRP